MTNYNNQLDQAFKALADPTRRAILGHLSKQPASMKELAHPFKVALPTIAQHMDILENCRLVSSKKVGRVRTYTLNSDKLSQAENWLAKQRESWELRMNRFDDYLKTMKE